MPDKSIRPGWRGGIYLNPRMDVAVVARGDSRSGVINRDLERLYALYARALREVDLTIDEACLIVDVLNGSLMDANTACLLWASVEDGIRLDGLAEKWGVDGAKLVEKLRGLNDIQALALVDAGERFWQARGEGEMKERVREMFGIRES